MFSKNVGSTDRIIRIILGLVLVAVFFTYPDLGAWKWVSLVVGVIALATGFMSSCLIYKILGLRTNKS